MNIFELLKNLKGMEYVAEEIKKELREKRETLSKGGITITFNGLGEVLEINTEKDSPFSEVKESLIELINQAQEISRDLIKEAIKKRFLGG